MKKYSLIFVLVLSAFCITNVRTANAKENSNKTSKVVDRTITYNLESGNNFISIPLEVKLNAKKVCELNANITKVYKVNRTSKNADDYTIEYACGSSDKNFKIKPLTGYFIQTTMPTTIEISGQYMQLPYPFPVLKKGYNSVGYYFNGDSTIKVKAEDLCSSVSDKLVVSEVITYVHGGTSTHLCSNYYDIPVFNNFDINEYQGYVLKVVKK